MKVIKVKDKTNLKLLGITIIIMVLMSIYYYVTNPVMVLAEPKVPVEGFKVLMEKIKFVLSIIMGLTVLTSVLSLIINVCKLGMHGSNVYLRGEVIKNILISGGILAVSGSIGFFLILYYQIMA